MMESVDEDSAEDFYEHAPCGFLSTALDGGISRVNATLLTWLGYTREELVGQRAFVDLLSVGGRLYHETHFAPLLRMQGEISGVALEMVASDGTRLPVLVAATVKTGADGQPSLIRCAVFDAHDRRAYEQELLRMRQEAERERLRFQRLASTLQRSLLPPILPDVPGLKIDAHYHAASPEEVGGDFYDVFPLADGRWAFFLGDVCGKGAAAAAVTSLTRYTLRSAAVYDPDPVVVLGNLNSVLVQEHEVCTGTVVFGVLARDGDGFEVVLASGGHPPALLLERSGSAEYLHTPGGQLVGILPAARFATASVRLAPGDTLLLYSDGLTEARVDASRNRFEEEGLLRFASSPGPVVDALRELLTEFGDGVDDDVALLALGVPVP